MNLRKGYKNAPSQAEQCLTLIESFNDLTQNISLDSFDLVQSSNKDLLHDLSLLTSRLNAALKPPAESIMNMIIFPNILVAIRALVELNIFSILTTPPTPVMVPHYEDVTWSYTSKELADITHAEESLLLRLLHCAEALHYIEVPAPKRYSPNAITLQMADPALAAGLSLVYDNAARPKSNLQACLDFFKEEGWRAPTNACDGPWQRANSTTGRTAWDVWHDDGPVPGMWPGEKERFNLFMHKVRGGRPIWFEWFDVQGRILNGFNYVNCADPNVDPATNDNLLMVDLSGGHGQDISAFHKRFSSQPGRLVLTDLPTVLSEIQPSTLPSTIVTEPYDLFKPLSPTLHFSKIYFLHMIFHDWPNSDCTTFLRHIRDAMKPYYSVLLINDLILPAQGINVVQAGLDMTMMVQHCGIERDESMWRDLIATVEGLEIRGIWDEGHGGEGIIEVIRTF